MTRGNNEMTIKQLGKDLVALGEILQRDDWTLREVSEACRKCGLMIGLGIVPRGDASDSESEDQA